LLRVLSEADVAYRELAMQTARVLRIQNAAIHACLDVADIGRLAELPPRPPSHDRRACFDAASYDRLRVLVVELERVHHEGGETALRIGAHTLSGERLARIWCTH
jgi:hypothetical protein